MRMGPGVPEGLGTHVSVELGGVWQTLAGGMLQVLLGAEQLLLVAVHRLSVCMLQVPCGKTHRSGVPRHGLGGGAMQ
jgi:hypothetical protein